MRLMMQRALAAKPYPVTCPEISCIACRFAGRAAALKKSSNELAPAVFSI